MIDLRSLVPLDREAILTSVAKTGRLVVVDEDYLSFGVSGEVVATVADVDPGLLRDAGPAGRGARRADPLRARPGVRRPPPAGPDREGHPSRWPYR